MLDQLIADYRKHIAEGLAPDDASRLVGEAIIANPDLLAGAWSELVRAALPLLGKFVRSSVPALPPGKPWFERTEWKSWQKIPVPVGRTGMRVVAAKLEPIQMRKIGQPILRLGRTTMKLGRAWIRASHEAKNGEKLPDVLPRLTKDDQQAIGEHILSFRAAVA